MDLDKHNIATSNDMFSEIKDAIVEFYMYFDYIAELSPIPINKSRNDVTTRLRDVTEWCKCNSREFETLLLEWPLNKDVEDLNILVTYICDNFNNWSSVIGNDGIVLQLINDVCVLKDEWIDPIIKQRNQTSPRQELQPLPPSGNDAQIEPSPKISIPDYSLMNTIDPTVNFDIAALYSLLISEGVIKDIDMHLFSECITHAHINLLWDISGKLRERNRLQCLFKMLGSEYYPKQWIYKCANNLGVPIKAITNPTRSGATDTINDKLRKILKAKN